MAIFSPDIDTFVAESGSANAPSFNYGPSATIDIVQVEETPDNFSGPFTTYGLNMAEKTGGLPTVDAQTFGSVMGQAVWLMTMSKAHRDLPIRVVEERISPAILLKQFRLFSQGKQPVAFLTWASVSDAVQDRIEAGDKKLELTDWRSGPNIVVLDCISPLHPAQTFIDKFLDDAAKAQANEGQDG